MKKLISAHSWGFVLLARGGRGFTLIELMVVVAVIAVLATIALVGMAGVQKGARDTQRLSTMNGIRTALERYNSNQGGYPAGNFSQVFSGLSASGYLTNVLDPGCGNGTLALTAQTDGTGSGRPCGSTSNPVYSYIQATGVYSLLLVKESAGTATLKSPL